MTSFDLNIFQKELGEWQKQTFPFSTRESKFEHLLEEVAELSYDLSDGAEMADIVILLLGIADSQNINLADELKKKFEILKNRKWGQPDEKGVVRHIE